MDNHANPYSLYIPRVSLSSSSSSSSTKSHRLNQFLRTHQYRSEISESSGESGSENRDKVGTETQMHTKNRTYRVKPYSSNYSYVHSEKRGSRSSQSSSCDDSNHSISSLLLSVKNLENFSRHVGTSKVPYTENYNSNIILKANYPNDDQLKYESHQFPIYEPRRKMLQNIRNIGAIDEKTYKISQQNTKDVDELSTTSSLSSTTTTNFTVVNDFGFNATNRITKSHSICRRSHQITILILVMSVLFLIGIAGAVFCLEMRYQKMPR
ncbi:unnamed protein product [Diamesa hyperborea]